MPLAAILGLEPRELSEIEGFSPKVRAANATVIGTRSIDSREKSNIKEIGLRVITMKELDMRGMRAAMEEAVERATDGTGGFHCSLDLDVVDPQVAREWGLRFVVVLLSGRVTWLWRLWRTAPN